MNRRLDVVVRQTQPEDFAAIAGLSRLVYPDVPPWAPKQLASHLRLFPEGQLVAVLPEDGRVVGMAASLIVWWDDYDFSMSWRDFTDNGMFTNHDPENGRTLYGAEVMVHPEVRRRGVGKAIYGARRDLARGLKLRRIRAGARLRGYSRYADRMSAEEYVRSVVRGELTDPTLNFQLRQRFRVIGVVSGYLAGDPASLGYAAVIEWLNHQVARRSDYMGRSDAFLRP